MIYRLEYKKSHWDIGIGPYCWIDLPQNVDTEISKLLRYKQYCATWKVSDSFFEKYRNRADLLPVRWGVPRSDHWQDPYLREHLRAINKEDFRYFYFGCKNVDLIIKWFEKDLLERFFEEGFRINCYRSRTEYHGLRESMFDARFVTHAYPCRFNF